MTTQTISEALPTANWFELIVESAPDAILVADRGRRIALVNHSAELLFGYQRAELLGQLLETLIPQRFRAQHPHHVQDFLAAPQIRAMGAGRELFGLCKDGREVPIEIGLNPIETPRGLFTLASIIDITARKLGEDKLRRSNAELEKTNRELDEFVYTASHDLRAPLTGVNAVAQWILDDDTTLTPKSRERLALIQERVRRMSRKLTDIHDYARAGRYTEMSGESMTATALLQDVVATTHLPPGFEVRVETSLAAVQVSRVPLEQVFNNLLGNAIKHHDRPSGVISVSAVPLGAWLRFSVVDDGPGIPEAYREVVFEMFRTLKPRDQVEGSGMGLALVRKIVARMGGNCGIEAAAGRGTRVWFDWPRAIPKSGAE